LFEVGISKVMFAQVGLLVHALSILNIDGLYVTLEKKYFIDVIMHCLQYIYPPELLTNSMVFR
jgi:hypothetical protein